MIAYILFYSTIFPALIPYCDIEKNNSPICVRNTKNHKQICEFICYKKVKAELSAPPY